MYLLPERQCHKIVDPMGQERRPQGTGSGDEQGENDAVDKNRGK